MSDKKYTSPEHAIRNIMELRTVGHNVPTANAFFKPIGVISPPKGYEHVDGSEKIRAARNVAKERQSVTMAEEEQLDEVTGRYNPVTGKYEQKTKQQIEAEFAEREKANQQQAEFENKIKQTGAADKNQNIPKPVTAPPTPPKATSAGNITGQPPVTNPPRSSTVKGVAKGVGYGFGLPAAVIGGATAYKQGGGPDEIAKETAKGFGTGIWNAASMGLNTIEGIAKTVLPDSAEKALKLEPEQSHATRLSKKVEKEVPELANMIYDPAKSAKAGEGEAHVPKPGEQGVGEFAKVWKDAQKPLEQKRKYDASQPWYKSVPMALPAAALGVVSGAFGGAEGGLAEFGKSGIRGFEDVKRIAKGTLSGAQKGFRGGVELPYYFANPVKEEKETHAELIKRVLKEGSLKVPKVISKAAVKSAKEKVVADPKNPGLFQYDGNPVIDPSLKPMEIDGYVPREAGEGVYYWSDKSGANVSPDVAKILNIKLKTSTILKSMGPQTGAVGSGLKTSAPPAAAAKPPAQKTKTAEPIPELPIAGKEPQLQKAAEKPKGSSLQYAEKPTPLKIDVVPEPPANLPAVKKAAEVEYIPTGQEKVFPGQGKITTKATTDKTIDLSTKEYDVVPGTTVSTKVNPVTQTRVVTDPRVDIKVAALPKIETKTRVVTDPRVELKLNPLQKGKEPTKRGVPPPKKRRLPFGLPGATPGQSIGVHQDSNVPVDIYKHVPKEYMEQTRYDIENVARPNSKDKVKVRSKQAEIIRKIIEEKKASKKNSTVIINPELKQQEPEQTK